MKFDRISKRKLIVGAIYVILIIALLLGISVAKYTDNRMAYTRFGIADFNAVILGENTLDDMKNGIIHAFGKTLKTADYRPGMIYDEDAKKNTAKTFPFTVANGISDENASQVGIDYSICLRTTENLPLRYTLVSGGVSYVAGEAVKIQDVNTGGTTWYERRFYVSEDFDEEALFYLDGGRLNINNYQLILEWPIDMTGVIPTNSSTYMKEVELLDILVKVSSRNFLAEENQETVVINPDPYGSGVIILNPDEGIFSDGIHTYGYIIDYRSFRLRKESLEFDFEVENGAGKGVDQVSDYTDYTMKLKSPYTDTTRSYNYVLKYFNDTKGEWVVLTSAYEYRLYNELYGSEGYGTYEVLENLTDAQIAEYSASDSQYKLYKVYSYYPQGSGPDEGEMVMRLYNKAPDNSGQMVDQSYSDLFKLVLSGEGTSTITENTAFSNKSELIIEAVFTDDGGSGSGGDS